MVPLWQIGAVCRHWIDHSIFTWRARHHRNGRTIAVFRLLAGRCGAASPKRPFIHRPAFLAGEGRQCGLSGLVQLQLLLAQHPLAGAACSSMHRRQHHQSGHSMSRSNADCPTRICSGSRRSGHRKLHQFARQGRRLGSFMKTLPPLAQKPEVLANHDCEISQSSTARTSTRAPLLCWTSTKKP